MIWEAYLHKRSFSANKLVETDTTTHAPLFQLLFQFVDAVSECLPLRLDRFIFCDGDKTLCELYSLVVRCGELSLEGVNLCEDAVADVLR